MSENDKYIDNTLEQIKYVNSNNEITTQYKIKEASDENLRIIWTDASKYVISSDGKYFAVTLINTIENIGINVNDVIYFKSLSQTSMSGYYLIKRG